MKDTDNMMELRFAMKKVALLVGVLLLAFATACATSTSGVKKSDAGASAGAGYVLNAIALEQEEAGTVLVLKGSLPQRDMQIKRLTDPERVLLDVQAKLAPEATKDLKPALGVVTDVKAEEFDVEGRTFVRITVNCAQTVRYSSVANEQGMLVTLMTDAPAAAAAEGEAPAAAEAPAEEAPQQAQPEAKPEEPKAEQAAPAPVSVFAPENFPVTVRRLRARNASGAARLVLYADRNMDGFEKGAAVFGLTNPNRLVFDLYGASAASTLKSVKKAVGNVEGVRIGRHSEKLRIVIDLNKNADLRYTYTVKGKKLELNIGSGLAVNIGDPQEVRLADAQPEAAPVETAPVVAEPAPVQVAVATNPVLGGLEYKQLSKETTISIQLNEKVPYSVRKTGDGLVMLSLTGVEIPKDLEQSLDTTDFNSPIQVVSTYQADKTNVEGAIVVGLNQDVENHIEETDSGLVWHFAMPADTKSPYEGTVSLDKQGKVAIEYAEVQDAGIEDSAASSSQTAANESTIEIETPESQLERRRMAAQKVKKRYRGEKISLELKNADIRDVLRLIADVSKLNIVASDAVQGFVTVRLINVPWDLALEVILKSKGYGMVQKGRIIRIAPQNVLDDEVDAKFKNEMLKLYTKPLRIFLIPVSYSQASNLVEKVKRVLSPRGEITFDSRTNILIVKDVITYGQKAEKLVASLDLRTPQVVIEARIVEAQMKNERGFGIQWGGNANASAVTGNPTGLAFPYNIGVAGASFAESAFAPGTGFTNVPNYVVNVPQINPTTGIGFNFGSVGNAFNLDLRLTAMESEGMIKIISSPRIATLDNTEAKIRQGATIPAEVETARLNPVTGKVEVQYNLREIKVGTTLKVKPHITSDGSILMQIQIEKKDPDFSIVVQGMPQILEKEAETELLIKSGETAVIGGMYSSTISEGSSGTPFMMHIPVIGWLFKQKFKREEKTELLIFLTPRIVVSDEDAAISAGI